MAKRWFMNPERYSGAPFTHQPEFVCTPVEFKWGGYVLASDYDLLAAELASLRAELNTSDHDKHDYRERLYAAEKELAEAKKDAERYRYLRANPDIIDAVMAAQEKSNG